MVEHQDEYLEKKSYLKIIFNNPLFTIENSKIKLSDDYKYSMAYNKNLIKYLLSNSVVDAYNHKYILEIDNLYFYTTIIQSRLHTIQSLYDIFDVTFQYKDNLPVSTSRYIKLHQGLMGFDAKAKFGKYKPKQEYINAIINTENRKIKSIQVYDDENKDDIKTIFSVDNTDNYINNTYTIFGHTFKIFIEDNIIKIILIDSIGDKYNYTFTFDLSTGVVKVINNLTGQTEIQTEKLYDYEDRKNNISIVMS